MMGKALSGELSCPCDRSCLERLPYLGKQRESHKNGFPFFKMTGGVGGCRFSHIRVSYSGLSLSRSRRDPLKHFEISVLRHIRSAELRKIPNEQPNFTHEHVI